MKFSTIKEKIKKILIWSQKYTKTDMVYLAHGGFWLTFGYFLSSIIALALSVVFANLIPKETYGNYKYILSIISILAVANLAGIDTAIQRAAARGGRVNLPYALKIKIKYGFLASIGSIIVSFYYYIHNNNILAVSFLVATFFLPFMDSFAIYSSAIQGKKDYKKSTKYTVISQIIANSLMMITLFLSKNIILIIFTYLLSWTAIRAYFFYLTYRAEKERKHETKIIIEDKQEILSYGKHLTLMRGINLIAGSVSNIFLFTYVGTTGLAIFSMAIAPIERMRGFMNNLSTLLFVKFSSDDFKLSNFKIFTKKILPFLTILILSAGAYIFLAPWVYKIFFPQYLEAIFFSQLYATTIIITALNMLFTNILRAKKKIREQYYINTLDSILNIFLVIPFIIQWKVLGLIFSTIIIKIITATVSGVLLFKNKD